MQDHASHKTRMLWVSGVLHAFTHLYQVALIPLYLLIQKDFKLQSISQATLLLTVMMIGYFVPSYPMGFLADHANRKKLLGFGLAINSLGFVGLALAPNYPCALVAVLVAGFGGSFYHPAATAMIARLFPVGTGRALGLAAIGASPGFFVGPIYTGWRATVLEPTVGPAAWRRPVLELGMLGILATLVFAWLADNELPIPLSERKPIVGRKLFPTPALWCYFFASAFAFSIRDFAGNSMGSLGSLFLQYAHRDDPGWTGLAVSGIFLPSVISNPVFGGLSDRGRKGWMITVLTLAAVMVILLPRLPSGWTIPVFLIYGFFFLSSYPMTEAAVMESVPDAARGRVFGLWITVGGLLGNLAHWVVGAEVRSLGAAAYSPRAYYGMYGVLALMIVLSLFGLPFLHALRSREEELEAKPGQASARHAQAETPP